MNIALDYDDTYTRDPEFWMQFIKNTQARGHWIAIVTWRKEEEIKEIVEELNGICEVFATNRCAKQTFMYNKGIRADIWIDDNPSAILYSMS